MQSALKDDPSSSKYQHSLPWALQNISPALAALHATRARALHLPHTFPDPLVSTHCTRCGTYLLDGRGTVRTIRKTKRAPGARRARPAVSFSRKLRRVCNVCGHEEDIPLDNANTPFFPRVRRKAAEEQDTLVPTKPPAKAALVPREPKSRSGSIKGSAASTPSRAPSVVSAHSTPRNTSPVSTPPPQVPSQFSTPSANPQSASRTKARPKKKSGLQEMLARNRERQAEERKSGASGGLAAFLDSL